MAFRLYIIPIVVDGNGARKPKYFADGTVAAKWAGMPYGPEPWMIVGSDMSAADDVTVAGKPDAFALPFNLDVNLTTGNVTNVKNKLEAINLPAGWVTTALTWRQVVRIVLGMCHFFWRFNAVHATSNAGVWPSVFSAGRTLDTTHGTLPAGVKTSLVAAAQSLNLDTSGFTAGTPIRTILKSMADALGNHPYNFNGVII